MRLVVYLDYVHRRDGPRVYAPRAFARFVAGLAPAFDAVLVAGRVDPRPGRSHYLLPEEVGFVDLPHYASAAGPAGIAAVAGRALRRWSRALDRADVAWVLGPQGLAVPFAALALARRKRVVLGVRQDLPAYARHRHPGRPIVHLAAGLLDGVFRVAARRLPVVVVGPTLAARYGGGRAVLPLAVSLVSEREIAAQAPERRWDGELTVLSVGRLEPEKNPLLLADVLAALRTAEPRWRLVVYGEGPLAGALADRLAALGVDGAAELRGYRSLDGGLRDAYREAHALLHVSLTEGLPQVLFEAFAARLPVVATAVGGVPAAAGRATLLVPPGNAREAAAALRRLAGDDALRDALVAVGVEIVRAHTFEAELARTARFLRGEGAAHEGGGVQPSCHCAGGQERRLGMEGTGSCVGRMTAMTVISRILRSIRRDQFSM